MTNYSTGHLAETAAAEYLVRHGYEVITQNWRTRYCEIDLIVQKNNTLYFIEVKYRKNENQGSGLEYITPQKLKQMTFAAQMWLSDNEWDGDYNIAAIELTGPSYEVASFIDEL
jgi:uncharacterized protein (TIGR00252 family)